MLATDEKPDPVEPLEKEVMVGDGYPNIIHEGDMGQALSGRAVPVAGSSPNASVPRREAWTCDHIPVCESLPFHRRRKEVPALIRGFVNQVKRVGTLSPNEGPERAILRVEVDVLNAEEAIREIQALTFAASRMT